ncbi:MAG: VWA domain-containing protein [Planctomycetota bacterium]
MIPILLLALVHSPADKSLDQAIASRDTTRTVTQIQALVQKYGFQAFSTVADAIADVESVAEGQWYVVDRHRIFIASVKAFSGITDSQLGSEISKVLKQNRRWPARIFALEVSLQSASIDSVQLALSAIDDKSPQAASVAARILGWSQSVLAIEPLISAMTRWEQASTRDRVVHGGRKELDKRAGDRAWLACRDALERLTGISLHAADQYKNWVAAHRDEIDPSKVDLTKPREKVTGTGLFGLDITGKNIVFVIDISGSMLATDPPSDEEMERIQRSTGIGDSIEEKIHQLMEGRRRIKRARNELRRAIESLGEDKNFSLISFSSAVQPWSDVLVPATKENRKSAVQFIDGFRAHGITVTDEALLEALSDATVDTIYLITDGAPTHIGSQGDQMPPDAADLMKRILEDTRAINHLRGIRIFTLGFIGAEEDFLDTLAKDNHGRYVRIR